MHDNAHDKISAARHILSCYNRMKLEIDTLSRSIEFYSSHKQSEIESDIYGLSVSHPAESSGANPNVSPDKIPGIAERIDSMSCEYDSELSKMRYKHNVYSYAVKSIDSFAAYLPADETKIIKWLYMDKSRKTFGEISAEINLSERRIKQIANNILLKYYETANYDLDLILELL